MDTTSFWQHISVRKNDYPTLNKTIEVDVAIIGGGITGLTAAAELIAAGQKIIILEAQKIGGVTTGCSTGNLYIPIQAFYQKIKKKFNFNIARAVAHSRKYAIDYIEHNVKQYKISCQFSRRPWYGFSSNPHLKLNKEIDLLQEMDIKTEVVNEVPFPFKCKKVALIPEQARFNPLQYVITLAEKLNQLGCLIFENTRVINVEEKDVCELTTEHGKILAKKVILATHSPIGIHRIQFFTAAYRSYVVAVETKTTHYPEAHLWDFDEKPHSFSTHATPDENQPNVLMASGFHHKTGQGHHMENNFEKIMHHIKLHFPDASPVFKWSAQHFQSADGLPFIGMLSPSLKNTFIATGYFADGLIYGTLAGLVLSKTILGKADPLQEIYKATRFKPLASSGFLLSENTNVFLQYLKDFPIFDKEFLNVKKGEGKLVEINQEKLAVSRDEKNNLHVVSAVCTHMKCIVNWNNAEKTWDCPCHGSRFAMNGEVLEGPATHHLTRKEV